jgi:hypothetical protein
MIFADSEPAPIRLIQYSVSSGDMFYAEVEHRAILLGKDRSGHIRIWGENASNPDSKIGVCRIFLEFGLYCSTRCSLAEAQDHMESFGERLGYGLAMYIQENPDLVAADDPTVRALEQIFGAIGVDFTEDHLQAGVRFLASHCPIEEAAKRLGLPYAALARHGVHAMCRRLIHEMAPGVILLTAEDNQPELMFTLATAAAV